MRLSTSTNMCEYADNQMVDFAYSVPESIEMIKAAGFEAGDVCFCTFCRRDYPMVRSDWKKWVESIGEAQERTGLILSQSHAHFYDIDKSENQEWDEELVRRSIEAAGMLNIPWITLHPQSIRDGSGFRWPKNRELNLRMIEKYAGWAQKYGVGLAMENMVESRNGGRRYCAQTEDLVDLVSAFNQPDICGITWDTGHAHMSRINQADALRMVGKWLRATHIDDNKGEHDDHVLPFMGNIDWRAVVGTLKEIGYEGDFTYETFAFTNPLPNDKEFHMAALTYAREVGSYVLKNY